MATEKLTWSAFTGGVRTTKIKPNAARKQYFRIGYTPPDIFRSSCLTKRRLLKKKLLCNYCAKNRPNIADFAQRLAHYPFSFPLSIHPFQHQPYCPIQIREP